MTNHPAYSSTQTELRFLYDAEHRRVQKIISENGIPVDVTAFLYDDFKVIATLDSSGNPKQTFHWTHEGPGGLLALTDHRTSPRQTHVAGYDGRGNLTTLLNAADASLSAAYEYAPFGEVIRATGPYAPQNPFGFSTTWTDRTTHLNYYGYRFYHPAEGRFLNQDPIEEQGGNNLYAAFSGDPVNRWDFKGLWDGDVPLYILDAITFSYEPIYGAMEYWLNRMFSRHGAIPKYGDLAWEYEYLEAIDEIARLEEEETQEEDETQKEEWKPTKENCDELRAQYPNAFIPANKTVPHSDTAFDDVMLSATIATAATAQSGRTEFASVIQSSMHGIYFRPPVEGIVVQVQNGQNYFKFPFTYRGVPHSIIGFTHSQDIPFSKYLEIYPGASFDQYKSGTEQFSNADISLARGFDVPLGLHTRENALKVLSPSYSGNPHKGEAFGNIPSDIVEKLVQCAGKEN